MTIKEMLWKQAEKEGWRPKPLISGTLNALSSGHRDGYIEGPGGRPWDWDATALAGISHGKLRASGGMGPRRAAFLYRAMLSAGLQIPYDVPPELMDPPQKTALRRRKGEIPHRICVRGQERDDLWVGLPHRAQERDYIRHDDDAYRVVWVNVIIDPDKGFQWYELYCEEVELSALYDGEAVDE